MHLPTTRRSVFVLTMAALLLASCSRRPATEPAGTAASPSSSPTVGTSGNAEPAAPPAAARATPVTVKRDADAINALEKMGAYLRTLKTFGIRSETSRDEVLTDGQNVQFDGVVDMIVERPNRLRAEVTSDKQQRFFFYDGTNFSLWARRTNYYATVPAPSTLAELADTLATKYDLELPLVDLFYWGERKNTSNITGAIDAGPSQVEGTTCEHYAFRQEGADWQVWIQQGDYPLPRKLVITTTTDEARPQFTSVMTWNLAPSFNDAAFKFVPPKDAKKIVFAQAGADVLKR